MRTNDGAIPIDFFEAGHAKTEPGVDMLAGCVRAAVVIWLTMTTLKEWGGGGQFH